MTFGNCWDLAKKKTCAKQRHVQQSPYMPSTCFHRQ